MKKNIQAMIACGILALLVSQANAAAPNYNANQSAEFSGGEHLSLGNGIKLKFSDKQVEATNFKFHLQNGLMLSYGEIISFGDYYGTPGSPIVASLPESQRRGLFIAAYHGLSVDSAAVSEVPQVLSVMHSELSAIEDGMKHGDKPSDIYKRIVGDNDRQYNCITGGGCDDQWWLKQGRFLKLAATNDDHFNPNAWTAYLTGHEIAIEKALDARQSGDTKKLEDAYAINAFASHFLADSFASGHIRTPRTELRTMVTPEVAGSLLSHYMHDEENESGLHVHNMRGDKWIAYGDGSYFNSANFNNREKIREALQLSADEIYNAFRYGDTKTTGVLSLVPIADTTRDQLGEDIAPMFYLDKIENKLMRRNDLANLYDFSWTDDWWGWSTVALLSAERGIPRYANQIRTMPGFLAAKK